MHLGSGNIAKADGLISQNDQAAGESLGKLANTPPEDGRRYSGYRFFAGLICAIAASVAIWTGVIYLYHLLTTA